MKKLKPIIMLMFVSIFFGCNNNSKEIEQTVNAILGDLSYVETFNENPITATDEKLRLQTHLKYVEDLLRKKDVSKLTPEQKANRNKMIALLNEYWRAGKFPKNYDYPNQRIPCFIDKDGNICAVGYLIEQTAGRAVAEEINSKYKYEYLLAMNDPKIDNWIENSGLTKEECAMIQPTYGGWPIPQPQPQPQPFTTNYISSHHAISSSILSGMNVSMSTINTLQIINGRENNTAPIIGMVSGAGQIVLGAINYPYQNETYVNNPNFTENPTLRNLSMINIGLGASTLVLSTWNLFSNKNPKDKSTSWNLYSFPTHTNNMGLGFSFTKQL